jgi:two-component system, cell cycle sensor histidine kinase and response regulator CckA
MSAERGQAAGRALQEALTRLLEDTAPTAGRSFFEALARAMPAALGMRHGMVGELLEGAPERVSVIAHWDGARYLAPSTYELAGTPCEGVVGQATRQIPRGAARRFPRDVLLEELGIESYVGVPAFGSDGRPVGILVAMDGVPIEAIAHVDALLGMMAARAGAEIERLRAERALRASERRYRQIVETTNEGVWTIDTEGRTTFVNEQMAAMVGRTPDEMLGMTMYDLLPARLVETASNNLERRAKGVAEHHESVLLSKSGDEVWTRMSTNPLYDESGAFVGALALVTDITEQRALDQRMQQGQKLESLGLLAGGIAHDFNNLLAAILGSADLALMRLPEGSAAAPLIDDVRTAARRAAELTGQLLQYAGRAPVTSEPVNVNDLIDEMVKLLGSVLSKDARLHLDLAGAPPWVLGDAIQIRQVLMNLVINANESLEEGHGDITLRTEVRQLRGEDDGAAGERDLPPGEYVVVEVRDTGCGFDGPVGERLFDPFFTTKRTGRGLGLAATLGILKRHGGAIDVRSRPGEGSTFTVLLPVTQHQDHPHAGGVRHAASRTFEGARVLLVEDEAPVRRTARRLLEQLGVIVDEAEDGQAALEPFQRAPDAYDVIMADVTMPRMGGRALWTGIRALRPNQPVLLTSGYAPEDLPSDAHTRFVAKPWDRRDIERALEALGVGARDGAVKRA